jgi:hypothetical protein
MRRTKKVVGITESPSYIILNERAQVYTGLIGGYPNFSDDLDEAKPLEGQAKFETLERVYHTKLEQMFI